MKTMRIRGLGLWTGIILAAAVAYSLYFVAPGIGSDGADGSAPAFPEKPSVLTRLKAGGANFLHKTQKPVYQSDLEKALARLGVPAWHAAGYRGKGLKIAVLDSGFRGYKAALGTALPAIVKTRSFRPDGNLEAKNSQHGILCAEVIHHIAPQAELLFANWEQDQPEQFLQAVRWARASGANIISCSIIMPTWSDGSGGGPIPADLGKTLGQGGHAGDMLCFASAGNTAMRHWTGPFRAGGNGWHQWARGCWENEISPYGEDRVSVELYGPGGLALEMVVRDLTTGKELGKSHTVSTTATSAAVVRFNPAPGHRYGVRLRQLDSKKPVRPGQTFHLVILGGRLQQATRESSVPFPGDTGSVIAVGALDTRGRRFAFSSCGPFSRNCKPDLAAPIPFPSEWRAAQPFGGTSAAAPQAAGLAALVWSRYPTWTAQQVRQSLQKAARRPALTRNFFETGHGQLHLPN
jgi:subtilisin family serine protease